MSASRNTRYRTISVTRRNRASRIGVPKLELGDEIPNLALLLQATNRLAVAEPLMRRALAIFVASLGADHPSSQTVVENYRLLREAMHSAS